MIEQRKSVHELAEENKPKETHSKHKQDLIQDTLEFYVQKSMRPRYGRRANRKTL
jgi:hypothetical protein